MESKVEEKKSSNDILIELFGAFNAAPPSLEDPKESKSSHKKSKKSKKSKKKKSKKHKKKSSEDEEVHRRKKKKKSSKIEVPIDEVPQTLDILLEDNKTEPSLPLETSLPNSNVNVIDINLPEPNGMIKPSNGDLNKLVKNEDLLIDKNKPITRPVKPVEACPAEKKKGKIQFSNLKNSSVFQETVRAVEELQKKEQEKKSMYEEGELSDSSDSSQKGEVEEEELEEEVALALPKPGRKRSRSSSRSRSKHKRDRDAKKSRKISPTRSTHKRRRRSKSWESRHSSGHLSSHYERSSYRSERHHSPIHRSRSRRDSSNRERKSHKEKKRSSESENRKSREKPRDRSNSQESSHDPDKIDKKKLLAIARKNALKLIDAGIVSADKLPTIASGGKTVNELTEYCKKISKREAMGDDLSDIESGSSDDDDKAFHHPFQVRDRPNSIVMNIKNAIPLPVKTFHEKAAEQSKQLRLQFPVSSGSTHRLTESEWVPVDPVKEQPKSKSEKTAAPVVPPEIAMPPLPKTAAPLPTMPPPPLPPAALQLQLQLPSNAPAYSPLSAVPPPLPPTPEFPVIQPAISAPEAPPSIDINSIVTKRLNALRKLQENPKDHRAKQQISNTEIQLGKWTRLASKYERDEETGAFTGSTGARILSAAQLSSGTQAWAKRDQLLTAQPVRGGMGMTLLQKMGWQPGEGLGKNKEGTLEPLRLEVKTDKKGLVATDEAWKGKPVGPTLPTVKTLDGKHPVSFLNEYCSRRHWGQPVFELAEEFGPDHKKNFLIKVKVNGVEYQPSVASINKKQAKAEAAAICLRALGLISSLPTS